MKKLFTKKLLFKIITFFIVLVILNNVESAISPIVVNSLALNQMNNSIDSHLWLQLYMNLSKYSWLVKLLLVIMIFGSDVKNLLNVLRSKISNEEN